MIRDADLIKDILNKDFNSFRQNHTIPLSEKYDAISATNPFFVIDDAWKESRKSIVPAFSTNKVDNGFIYFLKMK